MTAAGGPLHVLRHRSFRLFFIGYVISASGGWIQAVAQGWLVYQISGSAVWLGAIGFVRAVPMIFLSLVGGALADRFPKRLILYLTCTVQAFCALALGVLTTMGVVQVWHVIALATLSSIAQAFENPTRQSLVPTLVPREEMHAAIAMNAVAFNGSAAFGPSLTGILVPLVGLAGCFYVNAVSFGTVFWALAAMEFPPNAARGYSGPRQLMADLVDGLRYVKDQPIILALISISAVNSFFARPFQQFMTVFAADVFHGDVGLAGLMSAIPSLGTILFLTLISSIHVRRKGRLYFATGIAFTLFLIVFSWTPNLYAALVLLLIVGGFNMTFTTTTNTLVQEQTSDEMRGRMTAAYTITTLSLQPLGQGPMGWTMEHLGPQMSLTLGALVSLAGIIYMGLIRTKGIKELA